MNWPSAEIRGGLGRRVRFGIHLKFIVTIVLLIMLTSIIMSWFFIKREVDLIQAQLKLKGGTLVRNLAYNSLYAVLTKNQGMINSVPLKIFFRLGLKSQFNNPNVIII